MLPRTVSHFQALSSLASHWLAIVLSRTAPLVVWPLTALLLGLLSATPLRAADDSPTISANIDLRLRLTWGGGAERAWQGVVRLDDGQLLDPSPLGREADDPGSVVGNQSQLQIVQGSASTFSGCDFSLHAPLSAQLTIEFAPRDEPTSIRQQTIAVRELISGAQSRELDARRNRWHLTRAPGDRIRVDFGRDSLVFSPGEAVRCQIRPQSLGLPAGTTLRGRVELSAARGDYQWTAPDVEFKVDADGQTVSTAAVELSLPESEGVWDLTISLYPKRLTDNIPLPRPRPLNQRPLTQRSVQFVSIAPAAGTATPSTATAAASSSAAITATAPWRTVAEIDPAHIRLAREDSAKWTEWLRKIPAWKPGSSFLQGPIDNHQAGHQEHGGRELLTLAPQGWIAYPLPVERTEEPHLLEVEYPADWPQTLGISIVEPNAAGRVLPLGLDSGFDVSASEPAPSVRWQKHRLLFWPRTKNPLVLLTNRRPNSAAACGKITLLAGPANLPATRPALHPLDQRLVAAFFDRPIFPKNVGAAEALDLDGTSTWDDWQTFYDGGRRLVEYLKYAGYNSAIISVAVEGGAIYPSRTLQSTPKYDTGVFFQSGQDPLRKDVVELLFRLFDREGLTLIPAIQFASPLPRLEQQRRYGEAQAGWTLVDAEGKSWIEQQGTNRGLAPHYNILHRDVQQALLEVVDELTGRYAQHRSFGGLSLQLTPDGFAQLPGAGWGFDDDTLQAFSRAAGVPLAGQSKADRARFLLGEGRARWLAWRATELTEFYGRLADHVVRQRPAARLYLATADLTSGPAAAQGLRPTLPKRPDYGDYLLTLGIDPRRLEPHRDIVLLRSQRFTSVGDLATQGTQLEWNRAPELDRLGALGPVSGHQFVHEAATLELPSFEERSPYGAEQTRMWLAAHLPPADDANRQRFAHALAVSDPAILIDGGWLLPLGQEDATRPLWTVFRQLPATGFKTIAPRQATTGQPVVLRAGRQAGVTTIYAVNDSPWPVSVEVDLPIPVSVAARRLAASPRAASTSSASSELQPEQKRADQPSTDQRIVDQGSRDQRIADQRSVAQELTIHEYSAPEKLVAQDSGSQWRVQLAPYDLQALQLPVETEVQDWRVTLPVAAPRQLARRLQELRLRLSEVQHSTPLTTLTNPGFELTARDDVLHWLPARGGGIQIRSDARETHTGKRSLYLRTDREVAWVRSEPIPTPSTGRLALWVWLKTNDANRQPALRLAIEGRWDGQTYYRFATVGGPQAAPLSPQWTQYFLQVDDLPTSGLQDLRVGFDLMEPGEVWIDDVQLFDRFFHDNERDDLVKQIGQADFHLQQGRVSECERFLQGYWARYLLQNVSVEQIASGPAKATRAPRSDQPSPPRNPRALALRSTLSKSIFSRSPASQTIADLSSTLSGATENVAVDAARGTAARGTTARDTAAQSEAAAANSSDERAGNQSGEKSGEKNGDRNSDKNTDKSSEKTGWRDRVPSIWPKKTR
ncbi:MAG: hypothetical protein ACKOBW_00350 [Planctomycetota bacterium]